MDAGAAQAIRGDPTQRGAAQPVTAVDRAWAGGGAGGWVCAAPPRRTAAALVRERGLALPARAAARGRGAGAAAGVVRLRHQTADPDARDAGRSSRLPRAGPAARAERGMSGAAGLYRRADRVARASQPGRVSTGSAAEAHPGQSHRAARQNIVLARQPERVGKDSDRPGEHGAAWLVPLAAWHCAGRAGLRAVVAARADARLVAVSVGQLDQRNLLPAPDLRHNRSDLYLHSATLYPGGLPGGQPGDGVCDCGAGRTKDRGQRTKDQRAIPFLVFGLWSLVYRPGAGAARLLRGYQPATLQSRGVWRSARSARGGRRSLRIWRE